MGYSGGSDFVGVHGGKRFHFFLTLSPAENQLTYTLVKRVVFILKKPLSYIYQVGHLHSVPEVSQGA